MEKELLDFYVEINKLKETTRYKTSPKHIQDDSASHSWKVTLMALHLIEKLSIKGLDKLKVVRIALVHDLPEYLFGDTPSLSIRLGKKTKKQKKVEEDKAINTLSKKYSFGKNLKRIWQEYETGKTREAKFVKAVDKLEGMSHILAKDFIGKVNNTEVLHTATYADKAVNAFPELKPFLRNLKKEIRKKVEARGFTWEPEFDNI